MVADVITVRLATTKEELATAVAIRYRVFVQEQGVSLEEDVDGADAFATHALALLDGQPVGTGRVVYLPMDEAKIGRMAVELRWRRRGVASLLLAFLEQQARLQSARRAVLDSQCYIKAFYAHRGYREEGEVFMDAGIEHIRMSKDLRT